MINDEMRVYNNESLMTKKIFSGDYCEVYGELDYDILIGLENVLLALFNGDYRFEITTEDCCCQDYLGYYWPDRMYRFIKESHEHDDEED